MNYRLIFSNLGTVLGIEAVLMIPALLVSVIYGEDDVYVFLFRYRCWSSPVSCFTC